MVTIKQLNRYKVPFNISNILGKMKSLEEGLHRNMGQLEDALGKVPFNSIFHVTISKLSRHKL